MIASNFSVPDPLNNLLHLNQMTESPSQPKIMPNESSKVGFELPQLDSNKKTVSGTRVSAYGDFGSVAYEQVFSAGSSLRKVPSRQRIGNFGYSGNTATAR